MNKDKSDRMTVDEAYQAKHSKTSAIIDGIRSIKSRAKKAYDKKQREDSIGIKKKFIEGYDEGKDPMTMKSKKQLQRELDSLEAIEE